MKFVIYLNNQSLNYEADPTFEELLNHVTLYLEQVPKKSFSLSYIDEEGDKIDITSDEDMTAMKQSMSKYPDINIFVNSQDELKFNQAWLCQMCTFYNNLESKTCEICMTQRNEDTQLIYVQNPKNMEKSKIQKPKIEKKVDFQPTQEVLMNVQQILEPILEPMIEKKEKSTFQIKKEEMKEEKIDKYAKLNCLDEKIQEMMLKKGKLSAKVAQRIEKVLNEKKEKKEEKKVKKCSKPLKQSAPKVVEKVEKVEKLSIFQGIENHFNELQKQLVSGQIDMTKFNNEWNNEAAILKKRVQVMRGQAVKQYEDKQKSNSVSELQKQKLDLEEKLAQVQKSIALEEEKAFQKKEQARIALEKQQEEAQKQAQIKSNEVNNLKPLQSYQEKTKSFEEKLNDLTMIYGGKASDYEQILCIYPDATIEDLCDMVTQMKDAERERAYLNEQELYQ